MKKVLLGLGLVCLVSMAQAKDIRDGFTVMTGVNTFNTAMGDNSTGYLVGGNYKKYVGENVFIQPSIQYVKSGNQWDDKQVLGLLGVGYTYNLKNGMTVSPKVGVGFHKTIVSGINVGLKSSYLVGVELGVSKNWTVALEHNYLAGGNGKHIDVSALTLGYKF